ncbi:MAG: radical SAM protein, partial [Bacillota bacterium]
VPSDPEIITKAYHIFTKKNIKTEYLIGYEGNQFVSTGNIKKDLLSITAVHPLKQEAVEKLLEQNNENWEVIEDLIEEAKIIKHQFDGNKYYIRSL